MLHEIVLKNLQQEGLLVDRRQVHLVLAYSGGMDSTVLLHVLHSLQREHNLKLTAAFFEHGWRDMPPAELPVIHKHCQSLNVPLVVVPNDKHVPHTEAAARDARYYALTHLTEDLKAQALITAHQADDQIETMLFRLFRGTGIDGLTGIQKKFILHPDVGAPVPVLRPMLDIKRTDVKAFANTNNLDYFDDPTNSNRKHQRNLIRNEVVPFIQDRFPHVKDTLYRLSHVADGDLEILNEKIDEIWSQVYHSETLDTILFNQLGRPYQRRIIKRFLVHHRLECDFHRIEDIIDFVEGENRKNLGSALMSLEKHRDDTDEKRFLSIYKNRISVVCKKKKSPVSASGEIDEFNELPQGIRIRVPGEVQHEALNVKVRIQELSEQEKQVQGLLRPQESAEIYVDLSDYDEAVLEVRTRLPGDKIHPFGMASPMRLKNYFINRGVPRFDRDQVPLLVDGQNVLWVAGVGISEDLRVVDKPTHVLKLEQCPSMEREKEKIW